MIMNFTVINIWIKNSCFQFVLFPCCCGNDREATDVWKMYAELWCRFSDRKKALGRWWCRQKNTDLFQLLTRWPLCAMNFVVWIYQCLRRNKTCSMQIG